MRKIYLASFFLILASCVYSQNDEKFTNYYYDFSIGEQSGISLSAKNVVSRTTFAKLALNIDNGTQDYVLFFEDECEFLITGNSYRPEKKDKGKVIDPGKSSSYTVNTDGQTNYLTATYDFIPGGIYTFSSEGSVVEFDNFHLPPDKNKINSDLFKLQMLKLKKETDETAVKFEVTYTGDKIAIIYPSNCVIRTEDGKDWANARPNLNPVVLQKNESSKFTVIFTIPGRITDMQFAEMDIVWKDTFHESDLTKLNFEQHTVELDVNTTAEKN